MRDTNLMLTDAAVAADAFAASAWNLGKTPAAGIWVQFHITKIGADADERLDITVYAKDSDAGWALTDDPVGKVPQVGSGLAQNGVVIKYLLIQTDHLYAKPYYDVTGTTPSFTIVASIVSGPDQAQTA